MNEYDIEYLKDEVRKLVKKDRYKHTIGTSHIAVSLAMLNNFNVEKAEVTAILHDCAKNLDYKKYIKKYNIMLSEMEIRNPSLIHAKIGAIIAKEEYNIKNKDILNAINYHTTGRPNMSVLEKIIYVSDHIEPTRGNSTNLQKIRKSVFNNLDNGLILCLEDRLKYFSKKKLEVDPITYNTYKYYINS